MDFDNNIVNTTPGDEVEVTENDAVENDDVENVSEDGSDGNKEVAPLKKQSSKQDTAFADMRRRLAAAEKEAENYRKFNERVSNYGVKDLGEYFDKLEVQELQNRRNDLKEQGFDDATIESMVKDTQEKLKLQRENETLKKQQYEISIRSSFEELQKEYPDLIKTADDIPDEVWNKAEKGYSLLDAYESVMRKELKERQAAQAKQKTLNNINSKKHLKTEGDGPGNATDTMIDADTLQNYIDMGYTKKEAIAHYKKLYG